jgi:CubicO group peptidase (beta-lactamase class C family)
MAIFSKLACWMAAGILAVNTVGAANASAADEKTSAAVDEIFADLAKPGSPGCALGVYRDGKIIYAKGYGMANLESNVPITPSSVFDIGSTSKQFTAASILLLEKQGKLSVNDEVRKYIPELPDYGKKITIRHLLNHTSGLRDYLALMELAGVNTDSVTTDEDALALVVRQKALNFDPGSEWLYSNTGFFLLSVIVKRVSGKTLREFASENIFAPLEMTHTQYRDDHTSLIPARAMAYDRKEQGNGYALDVSYFEQTGDGAVHTSVEDLQKWDENFYSARIGGKDLLVSIQERGKLNSGKTLDYAKGLFLEGYRGLTTVSHGGAWGGYRAELLRFPEQHFSVACLCNLGNENPTKRAHAVADVYLAASMKPKGEQKKEADEQRKKKESVNLTPEQLRPYEGDYWSDELGVSYRMAIAGSQLKLEAILDAAGLPRQNNLSTQGFRASGSDEFEVSGTPGVIRFKRNDRNDVKGFRLDFGRSEGLDFVRKERAAN